MENRYRFLKEIVEAILTVWPADRVGARLSPNGNFNDMGAPDFRLRASTALPKPTPASLRDYC